MIRLEYNSLGATGQYAMEEAARFCKVWASSIGKDEDITIVGEINSNLEEAIVLVKKGLHIYMQGHDEASLLYGAYLLGERIGFVFDFSGEIEPRHQDDLETQDFTIALTPKVKNRGIRMHLNFVQDQSFFTEKEFEESIDNMAKLGFNYLVFHMYNPQEWYPFSYRGQEHLDLSLGNLERAPLADDMIGRDKVQVKEHWFPADLEHITDVKQLRDAMYERFKRLMARAKTRGMKVAVSIEPESLSETFAQELRNWLPSIQGEGDALVNSWQQGWSGKALAEIDVKNPVVYDIAVCRCLAIVEAFPDLDELHLISREGTAYRMPQEEYAQEFNRLKERFSLADDTFDLHVLSQVLPEAIGEIEVQAKVHQYWTVLPGDNHLATVLGALRFVEFSRDIFQDPRLKVAMKERGVTSCMTVYTPNPATIRYISPAVACMVQQDCGIHYLGDYGAKEISEHLENWQPLLDAGLKVGMISWLEFDGCMMLAQDWSESLYNNIVKAHNMGIETMYFNHWRVRSLEESSKVASRTMITPDLDFNTLMSPYLHQRFGDKAVDLATHAFAALEEATIYSKRFNFNVGFTNNWVFYHSTDVPGYHWSLLLKSVGNYQRAAKAFEQLAQMCLGNGLKQARYMQDLCQISAEHIKAVYYLQLAKLPLVGFKAWPIDNPKAVWPAPELLKTLEEYAQKAYELEVKFMETYAPWVESCDEQGQLAMHHQGVIEPFRDFYMTLSKKLKEGQDLERTLVD